MRCSLLKVPSGTSSTRTLLVLPILTLLLAAGWPVQAQQITLLDVVSATLVDSPTLKIQEETVRIREGEWDVTRGTFDPQLTVALSGSRDHAPTLSGDADLFTTLSTDQGTYSVGIQKAFRSGLTVTPQLQVIRQDNLLINQPVNNASVGLNVLMPLLRGRGVQASAAFERAARYTYQASARTLVHTRAEVLLQAAQAYWSYLAAWQTLDAYRETEDRARRLVEETQLLVAADEMPAADLMQLEANLASKTTQRIAAEQLLFQAEQQLGLTMGLPFDQMANLGAPIDPFPQAEEAWLAFLENQEAYLALAYQQRADLSAAQTREQSTRLLLNGARNDLRPRLDLSMNVGYAGATAGTAFNQFFTPLGTHVGGANVGISLSYTAPFSNRAAEGRALQRASAHQQQITAREDLDRTIRSGVVVALKALERSIYELRASEAAITLYTTAIENERKKLQMSLATLIDVLTVEDRLAQAHLSYINAQQRYANALVQLRFETGTLVQVGDASFDLGRLTTLPLSN